jgi:hypothetical protein
MKKYLLIPLLFLLSFVSPQAAGPTWTQIGSSPTRYFIRLKDVSGPQALPKITPPAGATVNVVSVGGDLSKNVIDWQSPAGATIGPNAYLNLTGFFQTRTFDGGSQVSFGANSIQGNGGVFPLGGSLAAGETGKREVGSPTFGIGTGSPFQASGGPLAITVTPSWSLTSPSGVTASTNGVYSLDLLVIW